MAPARRPMRVPTAAPIPSTLKIPATTPSLVKTLSRLSRDSIIRLALQWLEPGTTITSTPYLQDNRNLEEEAEEDYLYEPAESVDALRKIYSSLAEEKGTKRDVIGRILDGDWRRGISLQQLAMIDFQHLQENDTALRWSALKLVPLSRQSDDLTTSQSSKRQEPNILSAKAFPQVQTSTFLKSLHAEISPLVKAHYFVHRLDSPYSLTVLRLYITDSPYARPHREAASCFTDSMRVLYLAFPDSCAFVYTALSGSGHSSNSKGPAMSKADLAALKKTVLEAVPKALSKPHQRYALETTNLTAKSLAAICNLRGNRNSGASSGVYSIFADAVVDQAPLVTRQETRFRASLGDVREEALNMGNDSAARFSQEPSKQASQIASASSRKRRALEALDTNSMRVAAAAAAATSPSSTTKTPPPDGTHAKKRRRIAAAMRFGTTGLAHSTSHAPLDRFQVRLEECLALPGGDTDAARPRTLTTAQPAGPSSLDGPLVTAPSPPTTSQHRPRTRRAAAAAILDAFAPEAPSTAAATTSSAAAASSSSSLSSDAADSSHARAPMTLTFHGSDVFAGLRQLAELGAIDVARMPAWMTGEAACNSLTVRDGRVLP